MKSLFVYYNQNLVGTISIDAEEVFSFAYSKDWLTFKNKFPLSLALPLQEDPFANRATKAFFENLLPEGEVRDKIEKNQAVESSYDFLRKFGRDCAGAVIVVPEKLTRLSNKNSANTELALEEIYATLDDKQSVAELISYKEPGYLSLAGAQDKFPAIFKDNKFYLPSGGHPTTHIVKTPFWHSGVKESVYNEYYCMQLAKLVGLNVPFCTILAGRHPLFVIDRYDRKIDKNKVVWRMRLSHFPLKHRRQVAYY